MRRRVALGVCACLGAISVALWQSEERAPGAPTPPRGLKVVVAPGVNSVAPPVDAKHVVVIVGCTVRKDQLGVYGGAPGITPFIDSLAAQAVIFDDMVTAAPWTKPASVALLTGQHAVTIGMVEPGRRRNAKALPADVPTLATRFSSHGWRTLGATANPNLHATFGFDQGFERYLQPATLWRDGGVKLKGKNASDALLEQIAQTEDARPVYAQLLLVDAHGPYSDGPVDDGEDTLTAYRGALTRFDRAVEHFVSGLAELGLTEENTLFVLTNDHGEGLGLPAHHGKSHGRFLAPSSVGGVWLVWGSGVAPAKRVQGLASQVDLVPTLMELQTGGVYEGPGVSHASLISGSGDRTRRLQAYSDTWFMDTERAAVYAADWACQYDFTGEDAGRFVSGCYDRDSDPMHADPYPSASRLDGLRAWRARQTTLGAKRGKPAADATVSEEVSRQLEALGYVDETQAGRGE